ncbi:hypothetical protein EXN66_Car008049 [Channa argus]|uniref:Uncharacterized protein n=1 Tax=Channa argus TaxID=215402 RepID=A0A6G1PQB5_CHAAH|nr:hypothetical protein EXN66_Car008049 [Channa argus]
MKWKWEDQSVQVKGASVGNPKQTEDRLGGQQDSSFSLSVNEDDDTPGPGPLFDPTVELD